MLNNEGKDLSPIKEFKSKMLVLDHPTKIKEGYRPVLYCHQVRIPCRIKEIQSKVNRESGEVIEKNPGELKRNEEGIVVIEPLKPFVTEVEKNIPKLGRFVLRDANRTVAAGEILEIKN